MLYKRLLPTAVAVLVIAAALAATPAAATPRFSIFELCDLGETHYRVNQGPWQECPVFEVVGGVSVAPTEVYLPCQAGEGLIGPRGGTDPCMVVAGVETAPEPYLGEGMFTNLHEAQQLEPLVAAATQDPLVAYYVCEAGEGLIGPRAQTNYCRQVAAATIDPESYYPCDVDDLQPFINAYIRC